MYKQVCIFMYVFVCIHVYVCICTRACMYTCVYVHVCMYVSLLVPLYLLDNKHFWIELNWNWIELNFEWCQRGAHLGPTGHNRSKIAMKWAWTRWVVKYQECFVCCLINFTPYVRFINRRQLRQMCQWLVWSAFFGSVTCSLFGKTMVMRPTWPL